MTPFKPTPGLTERTWPSVILSPISVTGHIITVSSTSGLKVKQLINLAKAGLESEQFEIKRVFDNNTIMVGPVGKNIKLTSDAEKFDGGTLYLNEQSRNKLGDAPILRAVYEEEPTIAIRTIGVTPTGNLEGTPGADLDTVSPDARFVYGCAYETLQIREYAPSTKVYNGNIVVDSGTSTVAVTETQPWMTVGAKFLAMKVLVGGDVQAIEEYEITGISGTTLDVTPAPAASYTGDGLLDGSIGEKVKVTNFEYGSAYEVTNMFVTFDAVTADDVVKKVR